MHAAVGMPIEIAAMKCCMPRRCLVMLSACDGLATTKVYCVLLVLQRQGVLLLEGAGGGWGCQGADGLSRLSGRATTTFRASTVGA